MPGPESRLESALKGGEGVRLIPYLMAGYPSPAASVELGLGFAAAGAAAIEVGVPFSDPLADGPVIQEVGQAALNGGMTLAGALEVAHKIATSGVPVVVMTYVNPVLALGAGRFARQAALAGVAGVIVPDLPIDEAGPIAQCCREQVLDTVFLVAPTTGETRIAQIAAQSRGFVYCVTLTGVTGGRAELAPDLEALLERVRRHSSIPIAAGFGISRPEHVRRLRGRADAAVIGSALMERVIRGEDAVGAFRDLVVAGR
ncbi:MAG: tryptophan synthase subunit alpha [Candidatus Dormibacteraceae bacterium]